MRQAASDDILFLPQEGASAPSNALTGALLGGHQSGHYWCPLGGTGALLGQKRISSPAARLTWILINASRILECKIHQFFRERACMQSHGICVVVIIRVKI